MDEDGLGRFSCGVKEDYEGFRAAAEEEMRSNRKNMALLYIKCDKYTLLNDNVGVAFSKWLLDEYSKLVEAKRTRERALATRYFSDVFLYLTEYEDMEDMEKRMDIGYEEFREWNKKVCPDIRLSIQCGIYPVPPGDTDVDSMVEFANIARMAAPQDGYAVFSDSMRARAVREKEMERLMVDALENEEFTVCLQPKLDIRTKKVVGAEALMRWHSPNEKIMPSEFVPLFEKNGFISKMDNYMAERVFQTLHKWLEEGRGIVPVSMNVSDEHMKDPVFVEKLKTLGKKYQIPPHMLELEIRESMFDSEAERMAATIPDLRRLGVTFAVDNFGKGSVSLSRLYDLPIDVLKINNEFFGHRHFSERERSMLSHLIRMAKSLDMKVLYQGVESEEQEEALLGVGCDYVQGFLYARPMTADAFQRYLEQHG